MNKGDDECRKGLCTTSSTSGRVEVSSTIRDTQFKQLNAEDLWQMEVAKVDKLIEVPKMHNSCEGGERINGGKA